MCVCVCVCVYIYIYMCVCVCRISYLPQTSPIRGCCSKEEVAVFLPFVVRFSFRLCGIPFWYLFVYPGCIIVTIVMKEIFTQNFGPPIGISLLTIAIFMINKACFVLVLIDTA